jgi:hypothetical protein
LKELTLKKQDQVIPLVKLLGAIHARLLPAHAHNVIINVHGRSFAGGVFLKTYLRQFELP